MAKTRVIIMGAAGRDFHNFNVFFRNNPDYEVVAFTATQIPFIEDRKYPAVLSGELYPQGIPIFPEEELFDLMKKENVEQVILAYSDLSHHTVMHKASDILAKGADFRLMGANTTMLKSSKPVVSVCAVRTGCGKSQTSRKVAEVLSDMGKKVVAIRHPMPYGDLAAQRVQRYATLDDLKKYKCTIEEMEEYEPYVVRGMIIYAGVDYEAILREAEKEADIILWDGGNNDLPFYHPDLEIVVVDPHRPNHEIGYYPGESNFRRADVIVINKLDSADSENVAIVREHIRQENPDAIVIDAASPLYLENSEQIRGKRVLAIEDGPTLTHGEMKYGAGVVAAKKYGAKELVDPRPFAVGTIADAFKKYPEVGTLLPALGYSDQQIKDLQDTIDKVDCDLIVIGTPIDLRRIVKLKKPAIRVRYELQEIGKPDLKDVLKRFSC
jgi:predicted GTPase